MRIKILIMILCGSIVFISTSWKVIGNSDCRGVLWVLIYKWKSKTTVNCRWGFLEGWLGRNNIILNNPPWDYKLQYGRFLEQHFFIQQAPPPDEESGVVEPGHVLKYSAYKNLASLAEKRGQWEKSIDAYLQVGACAFKHVQSTPFIADTVGTLS